MYAEREQKEELRVSGRETVVTIWIKFIFLTVLDARAVTELGTQCYRLQKRSEHDPGRICVSQHQKHCIPPFFLSVRVDNMNKTQFRTRSRSRSRPESATLSVTDETILVRNYDATSATVRVSFLNADDNVVFRRTYTLAPGEVVSTPTRLHRGVYRVVACYDESADDTSDTADCLIGSAPSETAVVEAGNGIVSVTEGLW